MGEIKAFIVGTEGLQKNTRSLKKGELGNGLYGVWLGLECLSGYGVLGLERARHT